MSEAPNLAAMAAAAVESMKPQVLWKPEIYYNQDGARIEHRIMVHGERPENLHEFIAHGAVEIEVPVGQDKAGKLICQPQRRPISANIEATTPLEASQKAKVALSIEAEKFKNEFNKAKEEALKKAQEDVASKNTRKLITEGLPAQIK